MGDRDSRGIDPRTCNHPLIREFTHSATLRGGFTDGKLILVERIIEYVLDSEWLADNNRLVSTDAWDEGYAQALYDHSMGGPGSFNFKNPYRNMNQSESE